MTEFRILAAAEGWSGRLGGIVPKRNIRIPVPRGAEARAKVPGMIGGRRPGFLGPRRDEGRGTLIPDF